MFYIWNNYRLTEKKIPCAGMETQLFLCIFWVAVHESDIKIEPSRVYFQSRAKEWVKNLCFYWYILRPLGKNHLIRSRPYVSQVEKYLSVVKKYCIERSEILICYCKNQPLISQLTDKATKVISTSSTSLT